MSWKLRKSRQHVGIPFVADTRLAGSMLKAGSDLAMAHFGWQLAAMVERANQPGAVEAWLAGNAVFPDNTMTQKYQSLLSAALDAAKNHGDLDAEAALDTQFLQGQGER